MRYFLHLAIAFWHNPGLQAELQLPLPGRSQYLLDMLHPYWRGLFASSGPVLTESKTSKP